MPNRRRLPDRRDNSTFEFRSQNSHYIATFGHYEDGAIGECFLTCDKPNSAADVLAKDASLVFSIALQYGVPVEVLHESISRLPSGAPAGPLGRILDEMVGRRPARDATGIDPVGIGVDLGIEL